MPRDNKKKRVCPECEGHGKIVNPSCSVWTGEDIEQNPEEFEGMLAGDYDITCPRCNGLRVIDDTREEREQHEQNRQDHRTYLMESGQRDAL